MSRYQAILRVGVFLLCCAAPVMTSAQTVPAQTSPAAALIVRVKRDSAASVESVQGASVRSPTAVARTNAMGEAVLQLTEGSHKIVITKLGYHPDSVTVTVVNGSVAGVDIALRQQPARVESFIVSSTRGERRVEDTPIRVETIDEDEIAEKVAMAPGDIGMMLNETSGLRVQATNPSLGGANVRIQGLRGRYSLMLADGLPLYGGQAGGLGLLQIPPIDLGGVEIIKGTASALYGSSALGGVIDLISRRPGDAAERSILANQTSRNGTDVAAFLSGPLGESIGATLLASGNRQQRNDIDGDGWTDMPGYKRTVVRPRVFIDNHNGVSAFITGGFTAEDRRGGTLDDRLAPQASSFEEFLRTRRADVGALARWDVPSSTSMFSGAMVTVRASGVQQTHEHQFGLTPEHDRHRTWFGEASVAIPRNGVTYIVGGAFQQETFASKTFSGFDYTFNIPSAFAQVDLDAREWFSLSASFRADDHSRYGTFVNPRVSLLFRGTDEGRLAEWSTRFSVGTGAFAPTPFVEETEATGLSTLFMSEYLKAERATSGSIDIGGPLHLSFGDLEVNATLFGSSIRRPVQARRALGDIGFESLYIELVNAREPTRTWGGELLARFVKPLGATEESPRFRLTGTYTMLRATESDPCDASPSGPITAACNRQEVALTPRHSAGLVATVEQEGTSRVGLEFYYTGTQRLDENPFRTHSKPYLIVGLMGERAFETRAGTARVFLNFENMTDVRQTKYDPLRMPSRGLGGRWTTDAWTDLSGLTVNGGVRFNW